MSKKFFALTIIFVMMVLGLSTTFAMAEMPNGPIATPKPEFYSYLKAEHPVFVVTEPRGVKEIGLEDLSSIGTLSIDVGEEGAIRVSKDVKVKCSNIVEFSSPRQESPLSPHFNPRPQPLNQENEESNKKWTENLKVIHHFSFDQERDWWWVGSRGSISFLTVSCEVGEKSYIFSLKINAT